MGENMASSTPDPFVDPDNDPGVLTASETEATEAARALELSCSGPICEVSLSLFLLSLREPKRNDVFKPTDDQLELRDGLWLEDDAGLARLAVDPHPTVRLLVARHEPTPTAVLDLLADDPWSEIRQAVLGHTSLADDTRRRMAGDDPEPWLREEAAERVPMVVGRCNLCGNKVKRPDRFLTCSIRCSVKQTRERVASGLYLRNGEVSNWKDGFSWSAAVTEGSGGIRGSGPGWGPVFFSFIPGMSAREVSGALAVAVRTDGLDPADAVDRLLDSHGATGR